jgi:hypothetical protein
MIRRDYGQSCCGARGIVLWEWPVVGAYAYDQATTEEVEGYARAGADDAENARLVRESLDDQFAMIRSVPPPTPAGPVSPPVAPGSMWAAAPAIAAEAEQMSVNAEAALACDPTSA